MCICNFSKILTSSDLKDILSWWLQGEGVKTYCRRITHGLLNLCNTCFLLRYFVYRYTSKIHGLMFREEKAFGFNKLY